MSKCLNDNIVYVLGHIHKCGEKDLCEEVKLLGVYSSKKELEKAIDFYINLPGFNRYPRECFICQEFKIDDMPYSAEKFIKRESFLKKAAWEEEHGIDGTDEWYYNWEFADRERSLYDAEKDYKTTGIFKGSCCQLVRYNNKEIHNPFTLQENVYISKPVWNNGFYFLAAEFRDKQILIYHYDDKSRTLDIVVNISTNKLENYDLELVASPLSLYSLSLNGEMKKIWSAEL